MSIQPKSAPMLDTEGKFREAKATSEGAQAEAHKLPMSIKTPLKDADPGDFVPGYSDPDDWYEP